MVPLLLSWGGTESRGTTQLAAVPSDLTNVDFCCFNVYIYIHHLSLYVHRVLYLVGGLEHGFYCSIYWE